MGRGSRLLHAHADWVRVLEAIYAPIADDAAWASAIVDAIEPACRWTEGVVLTVLDHDAERTTWSTPIHVGRGKGIPMNFTPGEFDHPGKEVFDAFFYPAALALTHSELEPGLSVEGRRFMGALHEHFDLSDAVGLVGHPEPGVVALLSMTAAPRTFLSRHERRLLSQVTLHLESGVRLRRRPDAVRAVLAADGRILDRADAQDSSTMIDHVRRIEKSRTRAMRRDPEALDLWKALVAGASSIVERREGSKRHYLVLENAPSDRAHRALTRREVEIVRMAARGLPVKLIAYGLGLSSPAVSSALASAAHKLGLVSRLDLVRVASLLVDTPARAVDATVLTETEREIFELVRMGLTNEEIARRRSRSVRTVANQVASVLRKTGSASRRAVVTAKPRR